MDTSIDRAARVGRVAAAGAPSQFARSIEVRLSSDGTICMHGSTAHTRGMEDTNMAT